MTKRALDAVDFGFMVQSPIDMARSGSGAELTRLVEEAIEGKVPDLNVRPEI